MGERNGHSVRVVHSEGGVAGGVVSEGQGYGLLLAAGAVSALPSSHPRHAELLETAYELFLGWRLMCERTSNVGCRAQQLCGGEFDCLPSWKWDDSLATELGTGSAPDGDEDAILGMAILSLVTRHEETPPSWWQEVAEWT